MIASQEPIMARQDTMQVARKAGAPDDLVRIETLCPFSGEWALEDVIERKHARRYVRNMRFWDGLRRRVRRFV
jgi:hypothetical protein